VIYIALLRPVHVTGYNRVAMTDLAGLPRRLGLAGARTLLQSGNLVFEASRQSSDDIETRLETGCEHYLGFATDFFVRSAAEWRALVARNPFRREAKADPARLVVTFLKTAPAAASVDDLRAAIKGHERIEISGKQAYVVYPDGIGRSKLTNAMIEKRLGARATARNWNTVTKLGSLAGMEMLP